MQSNSFTNLEAQAICPAQLSHIKGGSQMFSQAVNLLLIDKVREKLNYENNLYSESAILLAPLESWQHAHYRQLANLLDMPLSTVKYFLQKSGNLQAATRQKILDFMGYADWESLEKDALFVAFKQGLEDKAK